MSVEVDAGGGVPCGRGEGKHEVRNRPRAWIDDAQSARVEV
jgi:hypothetical protein